MRHYFSESNDSLQAYFCLLKLKDCEVGLHLYAPLPMRSTKPTELPVHKLTVETYLCYSVIHIECESVVKEHHCKDLSINLWN